MIGIYQIKSKSDSSKIYIGSSINIDTRCKCHLNDLKKNQHHSTKLQHHYNKYGKDDLVFSVILGCSKEMLIAHEQFFIDALDPYFNICKTAGNCLGTKQSEETKKKRSENFKGDKNPNFKKIFSEETRKKMRESHKGKKPHLGFKISDEHKNKLKIINTGNKYSLGIKRSEETKKKISNSKKGMVISETEREKKSKAMTEWWAKRKQLALIK